MKAIIIESWAELEDGSKIHFTDEDFAEKLGDKIFTCVAINERIIGTKKEIEKYLNRVSKSWRVL